MTVHPRSASALGGGLGLTGSKTTIKKVHKGPKNKEANHHSNPLLPLLCAKPALIRDSVNHPTAYSPVFCMIVATSERLVV
jgi:hypothetical protein